MMEDRFVESELAAWGETMCTYKRRCPYYNNAVALPLGGWEKVTTFFCNGNPTECARFLAYENLELAGIPDGLTPTQGERAREMVACMLYQH